MWDQRDAPLQVLQNPALGDPLLAFSEPCLEASERAEWPSETDLRVEALEGWVAVLEARIARLEAQTPTAYWRRFVLWIRSLWPWR